MIECLTGLCRRMDVRVQMSRNGLNENEGIKHEMITLSRLTPLTIRVLISVADVKKESEEKRNRFWRMDLDG